MPFLFFFFLSIWSSYKFRVPTSLAIVRVNDLDFEISNSFQIGLFHLNNDILVDKITNDISIYKAS
jgi:hypothetical protein